MMDDNNYTPGKLFVEQTASYFSQTFESIAAFILDTFYEEVFVGTIYPRQILAITGDAPFPAAQLQILFGKLGFDHYTAPDSSPWEGFQPYSSPQDLFMTLFVIVGRENFDEDKLLEYLSEYTVEDGLETISFLSQEDFVNYWLFGIETRYMPNDPRIEAHPGLKFLASVAQSSWPWPSTDAFPNTGNLEEIEFDPEHMLKSRYGYTVAKNPGLSDQERQAILDSAVQEKVLSLQEIVEHIARLVRSRKLFQQNNPGKNLESAIQKWERDLDYLKKTHYQKNQFKWPSTRSW